jgi:lon-related putative ATP-dependent protease
MAGQSPLVLTPEQMRRVCDFSRFTFQSTAELASQQTIFGQSRGVEAIEFGIDIQAPGYNLYVLGPAGSGRLTAVEHFINTRAAEETTPDDWCYVHNFQQTHKPIALRLPPGKGRQFQAGMDSLINTLRDELARLFEGENYIKARGAIKDQFQEKSQAVMERIRQVAAEKSFLMQANQQGMVMMTPIIDGKPIDPQAFENLPEEQVATINANRRELETTIEEAFRDTRNLQTEAQTALNDLRRSMAGQVIDLHLIEMRDTYRASQTALDYLRALRDDILDSLDAFQRDGDDEPPPQTTQPQHDGVSPESVDHRYRVNLLVENKPDSGAPVIMLELPTYQNLIGRVEYEVRYGMLSTDFSQIKSGALHRANGGFLIIRALDILRQPFAWEALKRALNSGQVVIEDPDTRGASVTALQQLEPEPIPIKLKVVLVGSPDLYYALYNLEESFSDLFRVKADFVDVMPRTLESEQHYADFIATRCHDDRLPHFTVEAVGRMIDYGSWLVSDQEKLSAQFGQIAPLIHESVFFARRNGHELVTAADVEGAIAAHSYRHNEPEELSQERITRGTIYIDTSGAVVGQVNGLSVINLGDYAFGLPSRLTARVYMGRKDVVQIDRESRMTGPIHDKGVLILQGYLGGRYAQDYPLSLTASLTFEQNYGGVEGDSASSTELYALLSALSGFPIRQDLAVTGSINQRGQVQPIGGATQKVEGFFHVCRERGLTGSQGVIIPRSNMHHLMLNSDVIHAVRAGQFHVYAAETVDEGIALLTGRDADDLHAAVDDRLRRLAESLVEFEERGERRR